MVQQAIVVTCAGRAAPWRRAHPCRTTLGEPIVVRLLQFLHCARHDEWRIRSALLVFDAHGRLLFKVSSWTHYLTIVRHYCRHANSCPIARCVTSRRYYSRHHYWCRASGPSLGGHEPCRNRCRVEAWADCCIKRYVRHWCTFCLSLHYLCNRHSAPQENR